jgi:hypothetical protein
MTELDKVAAEWHKRQKRGQSLGILGAAILIAFCLALSLGAIYLLIRFIHSAWVH